MYVHTVTNSVGGTSLEPAFTGDELQLEALPCRSAMARDQEKYQVQEQTRLQVPPKTCDQHKLVYLKIQSTTSSLHLKERI